jgi:hypothetical protein
VKAISVFPILTIGNSSRISNWWMGSMAMVSERADLRGS